MSETVSARHYHVIVDAPAEAVFDVVTDLRNLPLWSTHFCKGIRLVDNGAIVTSPQGDVYFGVTGDRDLGVMDWWSGPTMESAERWPTRVVGLPDGRSIYTVTAFCGPVVSPGMDEMFADELSALGKLVEERQAVSA